ncbi:MAG TPA: zf-HC2 domain-containing protein [Blastocatellia bacterium]|nr:zf-HC2 domain-containing protein [Blastocatellia bacterium]
MNHQQIDQFDLIDRYLMGKLLGEERTSFEAHFVDCPQCIARLQTTKNFLEDLRGVTAQAWQIEPPPRARKVRALLQARRSLVLAFGLLLLAAIIGAVFVANHTRHLRAEADQARRLASQWEQRYTDERQAAMAAAPVGQPAESPPAAPRETLAPDSRRPAPVGGNLVVAELQSLRGDGPAAAEPVNQITVPGSALFFAISVFIEEAAQYRTYRGTIHDSQGQQVWRGSLTPDRHDVLFAWFNPARFRPGRYSLIVEGEAGAGGHKVISNYSFVLRKTL